MTYNGSIDSEAPQAMEKMVKRVMPETSINLQPRMSLSFAKMIRKPKGKINVVNSELARRNIKQRIRDNEPVYVNR